MTCSPVLVLYGLPSVGKTTLGRYLLAALRGEGKAAEMLDGDDLRANLPPRLGFSRADRHAQGLRAAYIARLLTRNSVTTLLCLVAPLEETRRAIRASVEAPVLEVCLIAPRPVRVCRDTRGVYAECVARGDANFTSVEGLWQPPVRPDLLLDTSASNVDDCAAVVLALLNQRPSQAGQPIRDASASAPPGQRPST